MIKGNLGTLLVKGHLMILVIIIVITCICTDRTALSVCWSLGMYAQITRVWFCIYPVMGYIQNLFG